ncbi:MAG: hypothetical protein ACKOQW_05895, partial [Phycisphaerales bacterium]
TPEPAPAPAPEPPPAAEPPPPAAEPPPAPTPPPPPVPAKPDLSSATPAQLLPARDGQAHRYELRAFGDGHVEVWMDGTRVPNDRLFRRDAMVAVLDADGHVIERLDLPSNWTPAHGTPPAPGTYLTFDGKVLVPPAAMLGGRLEAVSPAVLAHMHAEHTAPDGSQCARRLGRPVALVASPHQQVAAAGREEQLGGRRQEADDAGRLHAGGTPETTTPGAWPGVSGGKLGI